MKEVLRRTYTSEGKLLLLIFRDGHYYVSHSHLSYIKKFKDIQKSITFFEGLI